MAKPRYESVREARIALEERGVPSETVGELFDAVENATPRVVDEYGVEDEVDHESVSKWLKIGFAETCVQFIDEDVWDAEDGVEQLVKDMRENAVSNATTVAGGVASRSENMMRLSAAMMAQNHERR